MLPSADQRRWFAVAATLGDEVAGDFDFTI
jgi:hypothetical protein